MTQLTYQQAQAILHKHCDDPSLLLHAQAVSAAMGAMADYFDADRDHWQAIGYLHDVDYQHHADEHLQHAGAILAAENVCAEDIRAILSHGYGICSDVEPLTPLEKSLFAVDELSGLVMAAARMRPTGIMDMETSSVKKKFKDKRFAAGCDRDIIRCGCERLGMDLGQVIELVITGMRQEAEQLGLTGNSQ